MTRMTKQFNKYTPTHPTHTDMHALFKELAIRRVAQRWEIHSNGSQHLAEGMGVAHLGRRIYFVLQQVISFRMRHHLCRQRGAPAGTRQLRSQGPVSVHAHCTEGVTRYEGREGANGVGGEIGVGGGNGDTGQGPGSSTGT